MWPVPVAQVWTHYKIRKLNMWTLFCHVCINFLNSQIWKGIMLELNGKPPSVTTFSTDFSFKTWFFGIYLNFQQQKLHKNQYLPHAESKSYQRNSIKSCSLRSFQQHAQSNSSEIFSNDLFWFSVKKSFNIQELLHHKSKHHETQPMHPSSWRAFRIDQECDLKHPSSVDLIRYKTKQTNKLPSFIDRCIQFIQS